jgi:ABC-2 type transport system permease protein
MSSTPWNHLHPVWVQVKREFWEHRGLMIAPLAVAAALLLLTGFFGVQHSTIGPIHVQGAPAVWPVFLALTFGWTVPFAITLVILTGVYLVDCLYNERRDRSILFWRSLPVSDTRVVLTKFAVGWLLVPLGTFVVIALSNLIEHALVGPRAMRIGPPVVYHFDAGLWLYMEWLQLYLLVASLLWYAPYAGYLLLVSAWARRSVWAWALIPPIVLALSERFIFGTHFIAGLLLRRFSDLMAIALGGSTVGTTAINGVAVIHPAYPLGLLASPQLWLGLGVTALFLALAIRLRRWRDEA